MTDTTTDIPKHPAKFTKQIIPIAQRMIEEHAPHKGVYRLLDPFAGVGGVHLLHAPGSLHTYGIELQPRWAAAHDRTRVGNALHLPWVAGYFDIIFTSPTYGNRLADSHNAQDGSVRHSYTHDYGEPLHPDNSGVLHFGKKYQEFHAKAWAEARRVLCTRPDNLFILNVSDFIRAGKVVPVCQWHLDWFTSNGFFLVDKEEVPTPRLRYGANGSLRVSHEMVYALRRDAA